MKKERHQKKVYDKKKIRRIVIGLKLSGVILTVLGIIFLIPGAIELWDQDGIPLSLFMIMFFHVYKILAIGAGILLHMIGTVVQEYFL